MKPQTRTVLRLLRERRSLSPLEALTLGAGFRLAARVGELRAAGYDVRCDKSQGFGVYSLVEEPEQLAVGL